MLNNLHFSPNVTLALHMSAVLALPKGESYFYQKYRIKERGIWKVTYTKKMKFTKC